jgi:tartrate dehydratase alpha subunit/fumarate hydratase class I-like protein
VCTSRSVTVDSVRNGRNCAYESTPEIVWKSGKGAKGRVRVAVKVRGGGAERDGAREERGGRWNE